MPSALNDSFFVNHSASCHKVGSVSAVHTSTVGEETELYSWVDRYASIS
jgi:hypothetical protein